MNTEQQEPTVGRIVDYRLAPAVTRPAIIVHVWSKETVNLCVFIDPYQDQPEEGAGPCVIRTSVAFDPEGTAVGQWSWPPRKRTAKDDGA